VTPPYGQRTRPTRSGALVHRRPALAVALLALAASLGAQQAPLPAVHVVATGGTISNLGGSARLTGEQLVAAVPRLDSVARLTVEQFSNVASGEITTAQWVALARRVNALFRARPEVQGVVVTHGTDTLEETAYFLDLTVASCHPVVVTGAMRNPRMVAPDGPANLYNAVRVAAAPASARRGALVLLNDEVFAARDVTKTSTVRLNAFTAPGHGPAGVVDDDGVVFAAPPAREGCAAPFDLGTRTDLPRVDVIYSYVGADSVLVDAAVAAGARGIVVAAVGAGGTTPGQGRALRRAVERGVIVVLSSRTGSGRVPAGDAGDFRNWKPGTGAMFGAEELNAQKARVLLMLALARSADPREIVASFRRY
jgi:L-asparaginase